MGVDKDPGTWRTGKKTVYEGAESQKNYRGAGE